MWFQDCMHYVACTQDLFGVKPQIQESQGGLRLICQRQDVWHAGSLTRTLSRDRVVVRCFLIMRVFVIPPF
jgi:hypothetical protein